VSRCCGQTTLWGRGRRKNNAGRTPSQETLRYSYTNPHNLPSMQQRAVLDPRSISSVQALVLPMRQAYCPRKKTEHSHKAAAHRPHNHQREITCLLARVQQTKESSWCRIK
jgi:hypothetical protein